MNISQYAAHRGCNESKVRKAIQEGRIPTTPGGGIDPAAADAAWEQNSTGEDRAAGRQHPPDPTIAVARRSKNLVLATRAREELAALRERHIEAAPARAV